MQSMPNNTHGMTRRRPRDAGATKQHCDERKAKKIRSNSDSDATESSLSLQDLGPEVFCHVLGFLGPTSQSLISLSAANKHFRRTMVAIGDAMLPIAQSHFRKPLRPKSPIESSTSLFMRHTRICAQILSDLAHLRGLLSKEPDAIQGIDVQNALNMSLDLLEVGPALSAPLEKQILSTCGKCGGKSFKYSKWMLLWQQRPDENLCTNLETSRLIMQTVVYRELQISEEIPSSINSFVQRQIGMKRAESTGCF